MLKILMIIVIMTIVLETNGEPDAMARPTRPKVFTNLNELQKYLELVKDYYSISGKARYGKRAGDESMIPDDYRQILVRNNNIELSDNEYKVQNINKLIRQVMTQLKSTGNLQNRFTPKNDIYI
ncbi:hypothetical protein HCN44_005383 [Aphidius gifuensis]|uniref:Uncharacterized protein n=1 Tax=Aphidius gifuensis TaxID=684658 RepID=A0A834Y1U5_APHGI|nr:uncharacterized protein LOC122860894 [Aphidius gifuensis]KAF7997106.1 hypothetical protein HCN44_005383 [Aphidius gifuensis]